MSEPVLRTRNSGFGGSGYAIPTDLINGKPRIVPGVTTITGVTAKPGIVQWAVDNTAAYAVANVDALLSRSHEQGFGFLRWYHKRTPDLAGDPLRSHHVGVLHDAAELGTALHEWVEADLLGEFPPAVDSAEMEQMVAAYLGWKSDHDIVVDEVEATVYNPSAGYAGTLDLIMSVDGGKYLLDIKTSRSVMTEHEQQLAALGAASVLLRQVPAGTVGAVGYESKQHGLTWWVEDVVPEFSKYGVLHVRPDDYDSDGVPVPAYCALEVVEQWRIDIQFDGFLGALALKDSERRVKAGERARLSFVDEF